MVRLSILLLYNYFLTTKLLYEKTKELLKQAHSRIIIKSKVENR
jgi:hypothetical protein